MIIQKCIKHIKSVSYRYNTSLILESVTKTGFSFERKKQFNQFKIQKYIITDEGLGGDFFSLHGFSVHENVIDFQQYQQFYEWGVFLPKLQESVIYIIRQPEINSLHEAHQTSMQKITNPTKRKLNDAKRNGLLHIHLPQHLSASLGPPYLGW